MAEGTSSAPGNSGVHAVLARQLRARGLLLTVADHRDRQWQMEGTSASADAGENVTKFTLTLRVAGRRGRAAAITWTQCF